MASSVSSAQALPASAVLASAQTAQATSAAAAPATSTTATQQAQQGAAQAQPQAEVFNAPMLQLPDDPSTRDVMNGLTLAMAHPSVNKSTAEQLAGLHKSLMEAEKQMIETMMTVNADLKP